METTLASIKSEFKIDEISGKIKNPGKFENEKPVTVYFYEQSLDGMGEDFDLDGVYHSVFEPTKEEKEMFDLKEPYFILWENSQGFVFGREMSAKQWAKNQELAQEGSENEEEGY